MFQLHVKLIFYTQLGVDFDSYFLGKGGDVFQSTGLFLCLSVCKQHHSKCNEQIAMKLQMETFSDSFFTRVGSSGDLFQRGLVKKGLKLIIS